MTRRLLPKETGLFECESRKMVFLPVPFDGCGDVHKIGAFEGSRYSHRGLHGLDHAADPWNLQIRENYEAGVEDSRELVSDFGGAQASETNFDSIGRHDRKMQRGPQASASHQDSSDFSQGFWDMHVRQRNFADDQVERFIGEWQQFTLAGHYGYTVASPRLNVCGEPAVSQIHHRKNTVPSAAEVQCAWHFVDGRQNGIQRRGQSHFVEGISQ
jgi:hypothetical protein